MQVIVDEQAYSGSVSDSQTIQELADDVCGQTNASQNRLVVGIACNGQTVTPDDLEAILQTPLRQFETVELQTMSVHEQVRTTLGQAVDTLTRAHPLRETAADLLNQGRHEAAMAELQKILEILKQVQETCLLSSELLGVNLETLDIDGQNFLGTLSLVKNRLGELKEGMESQDFVRVSDVLRYEFAEPLDAWGTILNTLQETADRGSA